MTPALDQLLVIGAISAAITFFVVRFVRRFTKKDNCGGDCCAPGKQKAKISSR